MGEVVGLPDHIAVPDLIQEYARVWGMWLQRTGKTPFSLRRKYSDMSMDQLSDELARVKTLVIARYASGEVSE